MEDEEDDSSSSSSSTDSSDSEDANKSSKANRSASTPAEQLAPGTARLAVLRATVHIIADWTVSGPLEDQPALKMACGRQLKTSSLRMISISDLPGMKEQLCNHPGCRHIWAHW